MLARLFVYKALSCPGSLGECEFTGNFSLGGLHCLGDRVASLCKSVSSYFGCFFGRESPNPTAFTLPSRQHPFPRAVETRTPPTCDVSRHFNSSCLVWFETSQVVEEAGIEPASSTHQLQLSEMDLATSHDHVHCGSTKPMVKVFGRLSPTLKCDDCGLSALWALRHTTNHHA